VPSMRDEIDFRTVGCKKKIWISHPVSNFRIYGPRNLSNNDKYFGTDLKFGKSVYLIAYV
jgi:hypothetical protein